MVWARNVNAAEKMWFHRNFQVFDDFGPIESHLLCSQWLFSITWTVHPSSRQKMDMFSTVAECDKNFKSTLQLKFNVFPFKDINQVSVSATRHNKKKTDGGNRRDHLLLRRWNFIDGRKQQQQKFVYSVWSDQLLATIVNAVCVPTSCVLYSYDIYDRYIHNIHT